MKKIFILFISCLFMIGCSFNEQDEIVSNLKKDIKKIDSYYINGDLSIFNNESELKYDVSVYNKGDNYKVTLINRSNDFEQVIMKNNDGVYVITPSLNKSYRFQSEWPGNESQIYILESLYNDIFNDNERVYVDKDGGFSFEVKGNYSNNRLKKEVIEFNDDRNIKCISVFDDTNNLQMRLKISTLDINNVVDDSFFEINNVISDTNLKDDSVFKIDDILYPLYMPEGTKLSNEKKINIDNGERVILTFDGDKPFTLIEETSSIEKDFSIIPSLGKPCLLVDSVASVGDNSIFWINGGIEYYLVSEVMSQVELIDVASSVMSMSSGK